MQLDDQTAAVLQMLKDNNIPEFNSLSPEGARGLVEQLRRPPPDQPVRKIEHRTIDSAGHAVTIRIYYPEATGLRPALVFYHGGGWVIGNLESHDLVCRGVCRAANIIVCSVDYPLAPEATFPAAPEACYAALLDIAEHAEELGIDGTKLAVGGDSAGGNLAAAVTLMAVARGGPALLSQILIYPVTDYAFDTDSFHRNADGYFLTGNDMRWFWGHYLNDPAEADDVRASPARAADLSQVPPALVITAQFDPLLDDGEQYAQKLSDAGVAVRYRRFDGTIHGFVTMAAAIDKGWEAIALIGDELQNRFSAD